MPSVSVKDGVTFDPPWVLGIAWNPDYGPVPIYMPPETTRTDRFQGWFGNIVVDTDIAPQWLSADVRTLFDLVADDEAGNRVTFHDMHVGSPQGPGNYHFFAPSITHMGT